ncbi:MAG TPA: CBS domain-containing protein [Actinomycetes bacterium]|nr:CBS domain-containing protein [Actinomycetes bacterium]
MRDDVEGDEPVAVGPEDPVRSIMVWPVVQVEGRTTLREVSERMRAAGIGAVMVLDRGVGTGIMTERDVVRALAEGGDPDAIWAADVMGVQTLWAKPDDTIGSVAELMRLAEVRHVPVREHGEIVGIVSVRDILDAFLL